MYVCTLRMLMKNTVQLVQQVRIHRCLIVHNAITIVNSAKVCVLANLYSSFMQQQRTGYVFHRTLVNYRFACTCIIWKLRGFTTFHGQSSRNLQLARAELALES